MSFECPVCYSNGESGLVIPQSCQHKICLTCYTNIVIKSPQGPCCPQCRTKYVKKEDLVSHETSPIHEQILIHPTSNLIVETAPNHAIRRATSINFIDWIAF
jgi:hypothetical protein